MLKKLPILLVAAALSLMTIDSTAAGAQQRPAPAPPPAPPAAPAPPPAAPPKPAPPPAPPPAPAPPAPQGRPTAASAHRNVELSVVITDTINGTPQVKQVMMLLASGRPGSIRTEGVLYRNGLPHVPIELGLDGAASWIGDELVEVRVTFTYAAPPPAAVEPPAEGAERANTPPSVSQNISTVLRSGRPQVVSRSADPVTNRSVTVELTATILEP